MRSFFTVSVYGNTEALDRAPRIADDSKGGGYQLAGSLDRYCLLRALDCVITNPKDRDKGQPTLSLDITVQPIVSWISAV
jgi:hypothetical protein